MNSVEDLVDAAIATLRTGLDAELSAIEAHYAGGAYDVGTLERPRMDGGEQGLGDFYAGGVGEIVQYPTIEVAIPDLAGEHFSLGQHESDVTPTAIVRAWVAHASFPVLYRTCCRWGTAIHSLLCDTYQATGRGSGFGADVTVRRYTARWRFNPELNSRDEVTSAVLLGYWLDAPDIRP